MSTWRDVAAVRGDPLLLARSGLRVVEVARLRLDDMDWRRGEITHPGQGPPR